MSKGLPSIASLSDDDEHTPSTSSTKENTSPVKNLIIQKEKDTVNNHATDFIPVPDSKLPPVKFAGFHTSSIYVEKKRTSNPSRSQRRRMSEINHAISASPSLKNLNKLKLIENKLTTRKVSGGKKRSVSGIQYMLKFIADKPHNTNVLTRVPQTSSPSTNASPETDKLQFICRLLEVKQWIDAVLGEELDVGESNISEFQDYFRNGVLLAEITKKLDPDSVKSIYYGQATNTVSSAKGKFVNKKGLYFKFTENIVQFLDYLRKVRMPDMFIFETRDLFEMKNFPKVIFCLQALSYLSALKNNMPSIQRVSADSINVSAEEIRSVQAQIRGVKLPNFDNIYDGVRVNVGSDIRPVALFSQGQIPEAEDKKSDVESGRKFSLHIAKTRQLQTDIKSSEIIEETPEEKPKPTIFASDSSLDDDYLLPLKDPVAKQVDTTQARTLFRDYNPTLDIDMEAIEKKYSSMIQQDNGLSLTGDCSITYHDDDSYSSPVVIDGTFPIENLIGLQSIARGALIRYGLFVNKFMMKVFTPDIMTFQGILRGVLVRHKLKLAHTSLNANSRSLSVLQTILKNRKKEDRYTIVKKQLSQCKSDVIFLQNQIRGAVIREGNYQTRKQLLRQTTRVIQLQSLIRGIIFRGLLRRHGSDATRLKRPRYKTIIRAPRLESKRKRPPEKHQDRKSYRMHDWDMMIYEHEDSWNSLSLIAKGYLVRRRIEQTKNRLRRRGAGVIALQSTFRGVLTRFYIAVGLERLENKSPEIVLFQSRIRGALKRKKIKQREAWFQRPENIARICKIQNFVRGSIAATDYKSLINERNPPLKAIRNYIGLLSGSDIDLEDEISIEKYKRKITSETKHIEKWEHDLKQLGVKLQLLKKNRISLEEVVRFRDNNLNLSDYSQSLNDLMNKSISSNPSKIVDKSCKNLLELYGKIFYLLQTKPDYFAGLMHCVDFNGLKDTIRSKHVEDWVLKVFNYSSFVQETSNGSTREEFLLMKLILATSFKFFLEVGNKKNFHDFLKARQDLLHYEPKHWERILLCYVNLPRQRLMAKNLFSGAILRVTSDSDSWYEPDPQKIYKRVVENDEEEGRITLKNFDREDPIDDPETRQQFVKNLSELREASYDIMKSIGESVVKVPNYMRCVCKEMYQQLKDQFPGESEKYYLSTVGSVFFRSYVIPLFTRPEDYGINVAGVSDELEKVATVMSNLEQVAKVLNQLVCMRPFPPSEVYLQPLNPFIEEFTEGVRVIIKDLINVSPIDECYHMSSVYDDVASHNKPILSMASEDVLDLIGYLRTNIDFVAPERNDLLRYLLLGAGELSSNHRKLETVRGFLNLKLQPITESTNSEDLEIKTLIMEAKRYIIYILQVQDGEDLLDLLLSEITPQDELRFKEIVKEEKKMIREVSGLESVFEKQALDDIYNSTYPQVKKHAIELVLDLEHKGIVTRSDCYQPLLNEISKDIKNKKVQKEDRERRLKVVVDTLKKLTQKERTCSKLYAEYIKDIDKFMLNLQNQSASRKKSFFSRLFSKQYYYQLRLKRKKGYIPRFGSFKYDGKYLKDGGIIENISSSTRATVKPGRINFMFSCEQQGKFIIDVSNNSVDITGLETLTLDDLLDYQYENKKQFELFGGCVTMNTDKFVAFIFKKFFEVKE
ncbi:hypothetical protein FOA43_000514 [Brettanomyces nanus]|uniref:Ras GTPase-activating-like protein IQGAP1 n=1 Tax=Eeniella nana TaxID=13502 RepID=A0A875RT70_EENNA|nr:uncharacterized protein FOA43_000514 [Brettanomyces nanus]QPG73207.1 hypothetical protein FOA43_000514 [Brettanomyces nanus]